jgi:hypothetical protein
MSPLTQGVISITHILKIKRLHNIIYMPHECICVDNLYTMSPKMGAMPNQQPPDSQQQTSMKSQITSYN